MLARWGLFNNRFGSLGTQNRWVLSLTVNHCLYVGPFHLQHVLCCRFSWPLLANNGHELTTLLTGSQFGVNRFKRRQSEIATKGIDRHLAHIGDRFSLDRIVTGKGHSFLCALGNLILRD